MHPTDLDDPSLAPSPLGGWSCRIRPVPDAVIATTLSQETVQPIGVFDAGRGYVHEAVLWRGGPLMVEPDYVAPQDCLPGRWLWGGVLLNHFGHFLTETTGRLWALDAVQGPVDGIVFVSKRSGDEANGPLELHAFQRLFFDLLGLDLPIRIVTRPTRVDLLEVPGQGFGIGPLGGGTPAFRDFMLRRFARSVAPQGGARLYISRSGLSAARGGILEEARLEQLLAAEGYEIYHPQKHSLTEQIARYKAGRQIVALDGSALHLLAMAGARDQQVAVIKRRDSHASDSIIQHLTSFLGNRPQVIDVIRQDWVRSDRKRADRFSIGELDFAALGQALAAAGFVPQGTAWASLTEAEARAAIREAEARLKRGKLTFSPLPSRSFARRHATSAEVAGAGETVAAGPEPDGLTRRERRKLTSALRAEADRAKGGAPGA
ncbi:glycosyltransferase family 61 protein [Rhodobacter sp. Har01]|uniref:glycosyltransferase family 61 protein n=1 Tax=Rhodobacter sp. Har01 TaxID=2883999 RepID=UPI001D06E803|nr:glycosyltransferase 61 family protein [Rhodobacter sp. Har01]MCB6176733.1 glycosyltransferase family 61 protein [Rhodobacter sp. Har01]